jgi:hypothetical protein
MLAKDRDEACFDVGVLPFPVPLNADPLVGPLLQEEVLGIDWQVVFRLASDHTGLAPDTLVQVYNHPPSVINAICYHSLPRRCNQPYALKERS